MTKALVIVKMDVAANRGIPNVAQNVSFVHTGVDLPLNFHAFIVTGTPAQLTAIAGHANFLLGQEILRNADGTFNWQDARTVIAAGKRAAISTWLSANGKRTLVAQDNIETFLQIFDPTYTVGRDDVFDSN